MGNAYTVAHILIMHHHSIGMAPMRLTLHGQRRIRHSDVFTPRTVALWGILDPMPPRVASISHNQTARHTS